jgi:hypothetical protein
VNDARKGDLLTRADAAWSRARELHPRAEEEILAKLRTDASR